MRTWLGKHRLFLLLLLLLIVLRIPHFNRPLSKHHDFNNAVILINAVSWTQAGGATNFSYTPLMNFQGNSNKLLENGPQIDEKGNHVYLSFGAGWYVLPYLIFQLLHIPPMPAALEVLNILIGLLSTLLLYHLLINWTNKKKIALLVTGLFTLMPGPLWYMGHSYVTTGIMLPLVLYFLLLWQKAAKPLATLKGPFFIQLFVCIILLMYVDWVAAFLAAGIGVWALVHRRTYPSALAIFATASVAATLAIGFIFWQFAHYLSWQQVLEYWQQRSAYRSIANQDESWAIMLRNAITHITSGYSTLLLTLALFIYHYRGWSWIKHSASWLNWAFVSLVMYNLLLFHWSASHEFAWMAVALVSCIWLAVNQQELLNKIARKMYVTVIIIGLLQFFIINIPGDKSITGTAYNIFQQQAAQIQTIVPADAVIFTNVQNQKLTEWYAKRTFNYVESKQDAIRMMQNSNVKKGYWIYLDGQQIVSIELLM